MKILFNKFLLKLAKLLDPERAHFFSLLYLKFNFLNNLFFTKDFKSLNTTFCNIKLKNPIGIAAGLDKNAEAIKGLFNLGVSLVEVGAVTPKIQYGNRKPRVFRLNSDFAIINRLGFNNLGMKKVKSNLKKNIGYGALGLNVGANKDSENKISDFIDVISYFSNDVDYFTINISSPNTHGLRNLQTEKNLEELLSRMTMSKELKKIRKPILIKISPDLEDTGYYEVTPTDFGVKVMEVKKSGTTEVRDFYGTDDNGHLILNSRIQNRLKDTLVQFRSSGIRISKKKEFPTLVAIGQVAFTGSPLEQPHWTVLAKLQSIHNQEILESGLFGDDKEAIMRLGNAANVEIIRQIAIRIGESISSFSK